MRSKIERVFQRCTGHPPVLWLLVAANAILGLALHFSTVLLTRYPLENLHMAYTYTVWVYGFYGATGSVVSMLSSAAVDRLPGFPIVILASVIAAVLRLVLPALVYANSLVSFFLLSFVMGTIDVIIFLPLTLTLKRVIFAEHPTTADAVLTRYIAINYILANVMDFIANVVYDVLRTFPADFSIQSWIAGDHPPLVGAVHANTISAYAAACLLALGTGLVWWASRLAGEMDRPMPSERDMTFSNLWLKNPGFYRFMLMCVALLGSRTMFRHIELTLSQYLRRVSGPGSHFSLIQSINPAVVVIIALLLIKFPIADADGYGVISQGTVISAMGPLLFALLLWMKVVPWLAASVGVFLFSVGEARWSPRLVAYALQVAPEGAEALFTALASLPSLMVKLPTSWLSAALFETFCAEGHVCDGVGLWSWIGIIAATTPIILICCERWLREPNKVDVV